MINLTVHKNTANKRKYKKFREDLEYDAKVMARNSEVSEKINGYGIVVWDDDDTVVSCWVSGKIPTCLIGELFKQTIARKISGLDARQILKEE